MDLGENYMRSSNYLSKSKGKYCKGRNLSKLVQGHVDEEQLWKLQKCLVGISSTCCDTNSLTERIARMGLVEINIRRI